MKNLKLKYKYVLAYIIMVALGFAVGYCTNNLLTNRHKNIRVWAVDNTVKIPSGLQKYLETHDNNDCKGYRGTGSPTGVSLFAVDKTVGDNYVKMNYGCSNDLTAYIIAVKQDGKWSLIQPVVYNNGGSTPFCAALEKYHISKVAEPECIDAKGNTQQNNIQ